MTALRRLALAMAAGAARGLRTQQQNMALPATCTALAGALLPAWTPASCSGFHASAPIWQSQTAVGPKDDANAHLLDKDIWDEVWAYEPRFGTVENPIQVPALLSERIIGVTDPEDDTLVIWGIIREGEPPKQLVAGGEFFVLQRVERVEKVGDRLNISLEAPRVVES